MMFRILALLLLPVICLAQTNSNGEKSTGESLTNEISPNEMKRNASFNLEEIKVRWKKAALENCTAGPCVSISVPGPVPHLLLPPQQGQLPPVLRLVHQQVMEGVLLLAIEQQQHQHLQHPQNENHPLQLLKKGRLRQLV